MYKNNKSSYIWAVELRVSVFFFFFFWPLPAACKIFAPQPGVEPESPAVEAWSPNHWTTREFPSSFFTLIFPKFSTMNIYYFYSLIHCIKYNEYIVFI